MGVEAMRGTQLLYHMEDLNRRSTFTAGGERDEHLSIAPH